MDRYRMGQNGNDNFISERILKARNQKPEHNPNREPRTPGEQQEAEATETGSAEATETREPADELELAAVTCRTKAAGS